MKQKKGKDYKPLRQWADEDRQGKKRLRESINTSILKGERDEEKLVPSVQEDNQNIIFPSRKGAEGVKGS